MITTEINKTKLFLIIIVSIFVIYISIGKYYDYDLNNNYLYKEATIKHIEYIGRSATNRVVFTYNSESKLKKGSNYFENDSSRYYESQVGNRFLVKMSDKPWVNRIFFTYKLYANKPVPDSIKEAPSEGWKELPTWAK